MTAPIALFVYNRAVHAQRTVDALLANELAAESDLVIFSDGPRSNDQGEVESVRRYLRTITGFRSIRIVERASNAGLARSIIEGVTTVCEDYGRVIVLEDDLVTSRWFLRYMNTALDLYADDAAVASIHGYCYPVQVSLPETFFLRGADCWGWGTWDRSWRQFEQSGTRLLQQLEQQDLLNAFDFDGAYPFSAMLRRQIAGKNDSWAVRWHASCFLADRLTLYPGRSLIQNIGNDSTGTHCEQSDDFESVIADEPVVVERIKSEPSPLARDEFARFLRSTRKGVFRRLLAKVVG